MSEPGSSEWVVAALYQFADLPDYKTLRDPLLAFCEAHGLKGSLLLAAEGINGTVVGARESIDELLKFLRQDDRFSELEHKESFSPHMPFQRMKVRLKKEIVSMGMPHVSPATDAGEYVSPVAWNELIQDPKTLVIDTRNRYETKLGSFEGAVDPELDRFRDFPEYVREHLDPEKHKRVAMFCTGGIRCEKATALLKGEGFEEVYHLRGGILKYLEEIPDEESTWHGDCFVFDERVAVDHELKPVGYDLCRGCRWPVSEEDKRSPHYEEGVSCPNCHHRVTNEMRAKRAERHRQVKLAEARGDNHVGKRFPRI